MSCNQCLLYPKLTPDRDVVVVSFHAFNLILKSLSKMIALVRSCSISPWSFKWCNTNATFSSSPWKFHAPVGMFSVPGPSPINWSAVDKGGTVNGVLCAWPKCFWFCSCKCCTISKGTSMTCHPVQYLGLLAGCFGISSQVFVVWAFFTATCLGLPLF